MGWGSETKMGDAVARAPSLVTVYVTREWGGTGGNKQYEGNGKSRSWHPVGLGNFCRGGKSVATWQPSCHKVFEESGSGRKFLDPILLLSHKQAIW